MVRGLVGSVPSETLESLLEAVARNSSEETLRLLDKILSEGHSPAHLAKQMVRFLRNAVVAKVAGEETPLLQISADERARARRVAARFSEEDLARFLQIMLRTHGELGYRQEQRFHLELGLLKLVHAQRLLPLEELLSGARLEPGTTAAAKPQARLQESAPAPRKVAPPSGPSPFEADRARKSGSPPAAAPDKSSSGNDARTRATEDPVVRRMKEVFGAEIRSVIDHKKP
jgi:DNA polymerase-3 subunit gamma/tau